MVCNIKLHPKDLFNLFSICMNKLVQRGICYKMATSLFSNGLYFDLISQIGNSECHLLIVYLNGSAGLEPISWSQPSWVNNLGEYVKSRFCILHWKPDTLVELTIFCPLATFTKIGLAGSISHPKDLAVDCLMKLSVLPESLSICSFCCPIYHTPSL